MAAPTEMVNLLSKSISFLISFISSFNAFFSDFSIVAKSIPLISSTLFSKTSILARISASVFEFMFSLVSFSPELAPATTAESKKQKLVICYFS